MYQTTWKNEAWVFEKKTTPKAPILYTIITDFQLSFSFHAPFICIWLSWDDGDQD